MPKSKAKSEFNNCFVIHFKIICKRIHFSLSLQKFENRLHEQGALKLGRLWTRHGNPMSGYHVNFTHYCIQTVHSQPIEVFIVSLMYGNCIDIFKNSCSAAFSFIAGNLVLTTELKRKLAIAKGEKADVSSVSPSSERLEELWVVCGQLCYKLCY